MPWSIADIEQRFLDGKISAVAQSPEIILSSFQRVEAMLGLSWIESVTGKGTAPTLRIIGMSLCLASLAGINGSDELVERIRRNDLDSESELTAIHLIRSSQPDCRIELYPQVRNRKADFRVCDATSEDWITVEVTRPNTSKEHDRVQSILREIAGQLAKLENTFTLDILFRREPTSDEAKGLVAEFSAFTRMDGQHQAELACGLGTILLNKTPLGQVIKWTFVDRGDAPIIGLAKIMSRNGAPHQQINVSMPFSDERAERILRDEARQLPQQGGGLVMINVGRVIGSFQDWEAIFRRRFQPMQHTRVSAVCLFEGNSTPTDHGYLWLLHTKLIENPHARVPLPGWLRSTITSAGRQYDLVSSRW